MTGRRIKSAPTGQREPVVDAQEERRVTDEIKALQLQAEHRRKTLAQNVGLPAADLQALLNQLTPEAQRRVLQETTRVENFDEHTEKGMWDGDAPTVEITGSIFRNRDRQAMKDQADRHEQRMYVWLYDPVVGGMHRDRSRFHINAARQALTEQNFKAEPIAPVWQPGAIDCDYVSLEGIRCPKTGFETDEQLDMHQRTKHRAWYTREEYARQKRRDEASLEIQRNQVELQRMQMEEMREQRLLNRALMQQLGLNAKDFTDPQMAAAVGAE